MRRIARPLALAAIALLLTSCGGGGDDGAIPPFWTQGAVVATDLNNDGLVDVAVATTYIAGPPPHPGYVDVYLQTAPGVFQAPVQYAVAPDPWGLSAGDFDGDGRPDLVASTPKSVPAQINTVGDSGVISILRQDPGSPGRFLAALQVATGGAAEAAAIAELTRDTRADIVVADGVLVNGRALLFPQSPAQPGTLLPPTLLSIGSGHGAQDIAVGDIDNNGLLDVALAAYDTVAVFYQKAGGFDPVVLLPVGLQPQGIALADLDGDGRMDIVTSNAGNAPEGGIGGASVSVLLQTTADHFARTDIPVADGARRLAIADLNNDTFPDVAVVSLVYQALGEPSRVTVLLQSSGTRGQLAVSGTYIGPMTANFIAAADIDGDGFNDIVLNDGPNVMLQRPAAPGTFNPYQALR